MQIEEDESEYPYTKNEVVLLVQLMKMHNMSIASSLSAAIRSGVFQCDEPEDYIMIVICLEQIKYTNDKVADTWNSDELDVEQWVKDALED